MSRNSRVPYHFSVSDNKDVDPGRTSLRTRQIPYIDHSNDGDPVGPSLNPNYQPYTRNTYRNTNPVPIPSPPPSTSDLNDSDSDLAELTEREPDEREAENLYEAHLSAAQLNRRDQKMELFAKHGSWNAVPEKGLRAADEEFRKRVAFAGVKYGPQRHGKDPLSEGGNAGAGGKKVDDRWKEANELWDVMQERDGAEAEVGRWKGRWVWTVLVFVAMVAVMGTMLLNAWAVQRELVDVCKGFTDRVGDGAWYEAGGVEI